MYCISATALPPLQREGAQFFFFINPKDYSGLFESVCFKFGSFWWISAVRTQNIYLYNNLIQSGSALARMSLWL